MNSTLIEPQVPEWDIGVPPYKVKVMRKVVKAKFVTNPVLAELLVRTGDRLIVEDAPWDDYWGLGRSGNGQNMLGQTLMWVRSQFRNGNFRPYQFNLNSFSIL